MICHQAVGVDRYPEAFPIPTESLNRLYLAALSVFNGWNDWNVLNGWN